MTSTVGIYYCQLDFLPFVSNDLFDRLVKELLKAIAHGMTLCHQ